jgi:hypothetical protein
MQKEDIFLILARRRDIAISMLDRITNIATILDFAKRVIIIGGKYSFPTKL